MSRLATVVALCASAVLAPQLAAQATTGASRPDSAMKGAMSDHMMGPWKEMNAFHMVMAATWHPASQKNDLAPLRAKATDLAKSAEAWASSKAPMMPHGCNSEAVTNAIAKVAVDAKALAALVSDSTDDAKLKESLKALHDTFEVAEKGCGGHGEHK
jgi:hypothetical protein